MLTTVGVLTTARTIKGQLREMGRLADIGKVSYKFLVKGAVSQDFSLQVFFMNHLPQAPENNIMVIWNIFENSRQREDLRSGQAHLFNN